MGVAGFAGAAVSADTHVADRAAAGPAMMGANNVGSNETPGAGACTAEARVAVVVAAASGLVRKSNSLMAKSPLCAPGGGFVRLIAIL